MEIKSASFVEPDGKTLRIERGEDPLEVYEPDDMPGFLQFAPFYYGQDVSNLSRDEVWVLIQHLQAWVDKGVALAIEKSIARAHYFSLRVPSLFEG